MHFTELRSIKPATAFQNGIFAFGFAALQHDVGYQGVSGLRRTSRKRAVKVKATAFDPSQFSAAALLTNLAARGRYFCHGGLGMAKLNIGRHVKRARIISICRRWILMATHCPRCMLTRNKKKPDGFCPLSNCTLGLPRPPEIFSPAKWPQK